MAVYETPRSLSFAGTSGRVVSGTVKLFGAVAAWNDARMTRNVLNTLSDRELDDIGLSRGDVENVFKR